MSDRRLGPNQPQVCQKSFKKIKMLRIETKISRQLELCTPQCGPTMCSTKLILSKYIHLEMKQKEKVG